MGDRWKSKNDQYCRRYKVIRDIEEGGKVWSQPRSDQNSAAD